MAPFRKKKALGQHFLKDRSIAARIASALPPLGDAQVLEIGPGLGALTRELLELEGIDLYMVETDEEAVEELQRTFPDLKERILEEDFLDSDLSGFSDIIITGNFPYSISSPLLVRVSEEREKVRKLVGMFQKEFADRVRAGPGSKVYGRISVLVGTFFDARKLFHVEPGSFSPPPKVRSSVIELVRNERSSLPCEETLYFQVVKEAFGQRRKTLRNALKSRIPEEDRKHPFLSKRAEELSIEAFIELTRYLEGERELPSA
jgi:16S rRNA (adenine1518-N6/adenine1519-N6)-dimethyltransferase